MQGVFKTGVVLIVVSFALWLYKDQGNTLPITDSLDSILFGLGCLCLGLFILTYIYAVFSGQSGKTSKKRCVRCGKKIAKGEMYCEFHKKEVTKQFRDNVGDHKHGR